MDLVDNKVVLVIDVAQGMGASHIFAMHSLF